jgi:hypothetical protein
LAGFGFECHALGLMRNRPSVGSRAGYRIKNSLNRAALIQDVRVLDTLGHARPEPFR